MSPRPLVPTRASPSVSKTCALSTKIFRCPPRLDFPPPSCRPQPDDASPTIFLSPVDANCFLCLFFCCKHTCSPAHLLPHRSPSHSTGSALLLSRVFHIWPRLFPQPPCPTTTTRRGTHQLLADSPRGSNLPRPRDQVLHQCAPPVTVHPFTQM